MIKSGAGMCTTWGCLLLEASGGRRQWALQPGWRLPLEESLWRRSTLVGAQAGSSKRGRFRGCKIDEKKRGVIDPCFGL